MADTRHKNKTWALREQAHYDDIKVAALWDIREELQESNRLARQTKDSIDSIRLFVHALGAQAPRYRRGSAPEGGRVIVIIDEPCDYRARVLLDGGQVEEFDLEGSPFNYQINDSKAVLNAKDGRVMSFNWSKVISIEYEPRGKRATRYDILKETAEQMIAEGNARPA